MFGPSPWLLSTPSLTLSSPVYNVESNTFRQSLATPNATHIIWYVISTDKNESFYKFIFIFNRFIFAFRNCYFSLFLFITFSHSFSLSKARGKGVWHELTSILVCDVQLLWLLLTETHTRTHCKSLNERVRQRRVGGGFWYIKRKTDGKQTKESGDW